ncbi:uncharacterized protein LOC143275992 isoform X2 [Babylonia areolata]|uniref:uncharacterized protein LOC143275992 isoform X2 n=1 Tax=Babylonia areolata TaxID=304850 RepID=UPI003FCF0CFB
MWLVYYITIIACLFSGISRCQNPEPQATPVLPNTPASKSATDSPPAQGPTPSPTKYPPPLQPPEAEPVQQAQQPHQQPADVADRASHAQGIDLERRSGLRTQHDLEQKEHGEASVGGEQTVSSLADNLPKGGVRRNMEAHSVGDEMKAEEVVDSALPPHGHQQQHQQKDSVVVDPPSSAPVSERQKEDPHTPPTQGQEAPPHHHPDTGASDATSETEVSANEGAGSQTGDGVPDSAATSSQQSIPSEPPSQPPPPQDSIATQKPPTQVESLHPDVQSTATGEKHSLPLQPHDQLSSSLPPGSGGMLVVDPDLSSQEKVVDEEGVKELTEDFQTFGEWRKKVLEEELEKENEKVKQELSQRDAHATTTVSSQKLRVNYASEKCGAKIVTCNPEMENGNHMLTANKDEYMINPCSAKKWFVVELCEPISVKMVEVASMELFSSQPRSFSISLTDRYPTKDWVAGGRYELTPEKVPQLFHLSVTSPYVKFVRVDMLDHYGNEHFCPVTLFRVFGVPMEDDEDDSVQHSTESEEEPGEGKSETLFAKTKATVVSLVKKVLYKDQEGQEQQQQQGEGGLEKHANFSGEEALPCDPDVENKRLPEKAVEGTLVTVHHPQPTVHAMHDAADVTTSSAAADVPMVTKLKEGEQLEIEEESKRQTPGGQGLVTLLESGRAVGWERALRFCDPGVSSNHSAASCPSLPCCLYVQALLGTPPPISFPRPPSSSSAPSSPPSSEEWSPTAPVVDLEPSFSSPVSTTVAPQEERESLPPEGGVTAFTDDVHVQPSSDAPSELTSSSLSSVAQATSAIPLNQPSTSLTITPITSPSSELPQDKSQSEVTAATTTTTTTVKVEVREPSQGTVVTKASLTTSKKLVVATTTVPAGRMVETDPGVVPASTTTTSSIVGESSTDMSSAAEGVKKEKEEVEAESSAPQAESEDVLQPSLQVDTTAVQSPTLTRPTPVLEMSGASSVSMQGKGEGETDVPSVSPSPTSHTAHPQPESSAFPQIIEPTLQEPKSIAQSQHPQSTEAVISSTVQASTPGQKEEVRAPQNETHPSPANNTAEKKGADLDLVTVPLTLSAKRESAVMRLTNRIKALELNVSLSSRFLEELSTRFKKQNEEMMKMLNKTMTKLNSTATVSQRQIAHQELRLDHLETRLDNLTLVVQRLSHTFDSFAQQMSDRQMIFTTLNLLVLVVSVVLCCRAMQAKPLHPDVQFLLDTMPRHPPPPTPFPRRNSDVALPLHHASDLPMAGARKKGGSLANLGPGDGAGLLFLDKGEAGSRKKKRKKNKGQKAGSVDAESLGGTESDPGLKATRVTSASTVAVSDLGHRAGETDTGLSTDPGCRTAGSDTTQSTSPTTDSVHRAASADNAKSSSFDHSSSSSDAAKRTRVAASAEYGHRRCGSATASFFSLAEPSPVVDAPPGHHHHHPPPQPPPRQDRGREVQFSLGGRTIASTSAQSTVHTTCGLDSFPSLPSSMKPPTALPPSDPVLTKPPYPLCNQRSKSLTTPPGALFNNTSCPWDSSRGGADGGMVSWKDEVSLHQAGGSLSPCPPPPPPPPSSSLVNSHPPPPTSAHKPSVFSKPKKVPAVMNGEREGRVMNFDQGRVPSQRKGSFRGSGPGEEGRGGGNKGRGGRKPGRGQSFEKA